MAFPNGVREYTTDRETWTVIVQGNTAIALDRQWAERWRGERAHGENTRTMAIPVEKRGWRKGCDLVCAYGPTSDRSRRKDRERFYCALEKLTDRKPSNTIMVAARDLNAEVGAKNSCGWENVIGAHGSDRRTKSGVDFLQFCEENGLLDMGSFFRQPHRVTWFHMKYGSVHELDDIMVTKEDRWTVTCCKTLHCIAVREEPTKRMWNSRSREESRRQIDKVKA